MKRGILRSGEKMRRSLLTLRRSLAVIACLTLGLLSSGTTGCGRGYPSYGGTYRLKSTQLAAADLPVQINFPQELQVIQFPFVLYNGVVDTRVSIGAKSDGGTGLYFKEATLTEASGTSANYSVVPAESFPDFASDPFIDSTGKPRGPSCLYTYGADARFEFSFALEKMTESVEGVYPRMSKEMVGGRELVTRPPGEWSDRPINYGVWDSQKKELTVYFSIFKKNAYGNLGICHYQGSAVPRDPESYSYSAVYELVDEQTEFDPRMPVEDATIRSQIETRFGKEPSLLWSTTFAVPTPAGQLRNFFP